MSGKLGIVDGVVEEELEDLVVEEPAFLPRVGHVGGGTLGGAVDACRTIWSRTVVLSGILFEDPAFSLCVNSQCKFLWWNSLVDC